MVDIQLDEADWNLLLAHLRPTTVPDYLRPTVVEIGRQLRDEKEVDDEDRG